MPKVILVTGCAGFIGGNFVKQFKKEFPKTEIIGIDDFSTGRKDVLDKRIIFYENSILDEKFLQEIFAKHKPEYVFHFAALPRVSYSLKYPRRTSEINILGTVALLVKARDFEVKRFIYYSSSSVYGQVKKMPTQESENFPNPKSLYAIQKYTSELFCRAFSCLTTIRCQSIFTDNVFKDS